MLYEVETVAAVTSASTVAGMVMSAVTVINVSVTAIPRHRACGRLRRAESSRHRVVVDRGVGRDMVFGLPTA